jgi:type IV secretory pathway TrbD component
MAETLPEHFASPVFQSLTAPLLLAGVPRNMFIFNACLTFAAVAYLHWWWYLPIGIGIWMAVKVITKYDAHWGSILFRALAYRDFYEA